MILYIIRHGQTEWNTTYQLQGQTDVPLNDEGRSLAARTGAALRNVAFDAACTSPLQRAKETAELVLAAASSASGRPVPAIIPDPRLSEISFGVMEGVRIRDEAGAITDKNFDCFFHDTPHYIPPEGGESFQDLIARTGDFLEDLGRKGEGKTLLISVHGAASRALLANMSRTALKDFWAGGVPGNCAVTVAEFCGNKWRIKEKDRIFYDHEDF